MSSACTSPLKARTAAVIVFRVTHTVSQIGDKMNHTLCAKNMISCLIIPLLTLAIAAPVQIRPV
jgi:hypothetical protein